MRILPFTDREVKQDHIRGILTDNHEVVNIHQLSRKVNSKPDLKVDFDIRTCLLGGPGLLDPG